MIDIFMNLKLCFLLVFLIGLVTGLLYIWRVSYEEYQPAIERYNKYLNTTEVEIDKKSKEIENITDEIDKTKIHIKSQKENTLEDEEKYSSTKKILQKTKKDFENMENILKDESLIKKSLENEYKYYENMIKKRETLLAEIEGLKYEIEKLKEKKVLSSNQANQEKLIENELLAQKKEGDSKIEKLKTRKNELTTKVYIEEQNFKNNKNFRKTVELNEYVTKLVEYRDRLISIKNKL